MLSVRRAVWFLHVKFVLCAECNTTCRMWPFVSLKTCWVFLKHNLANPTSQVYRKSLVFCFLRGLIRFPFWKLIKAALIDKPHWGERVLLISPHISKKPVIFCCCKWCSLNTSYIEQNSDNTQKWIKISPSMISRWQRVMSHLQVPIPEIKRSIFRSLFQFQAKLSIIL